MLHVQCEAAQCQWTHVAYIIWSLQTFHQKYSTRNQWKKSWLCIFFIAQQEKKRLKDVYTKGFAPLPKQKYAKNVDEYGRPADAAYDDPYDFDRPVDAVYDEPYEYSRPVGAVYDEPFDDVQGEPWRRPPGRLSREKFETPREYEEAGYVQPSFYREDVAGKYC